MSEISWPQERRDLSEECIRLRAYRDHKREDLEIANESLNKATERLMEWDLKHDWKKYQEEKLRCGSPHAGSSTCPGCR